MNTRAERDLKISQATGCRLSRKYAMETYGVELEEPTPPPDPLGQMRQGEFSDRPFDLAARRRELGLTHTHFSNCTGRLSAG